MTNSLKDPGMSRRQFLAGAGMAAVGAGLGLARAAERTGGVPDADPLAGAAARIERERKADGVIVVRGPGGKVLPAARVRVQQVKHEFLFGCNCFMFDRCADAELEARYRQQFAALFNFATLGFYWSNFEAQQGKPNTAYTDRAAAWCAEHLITCKGHPLVWDHLVSSPKWLPGPLLAVGELSEDRVTSLVAGYRGRIDTWDVVNEPTHLGNPAFGKEAANHMAQYGAWLGPRAYTAEFLKVARAANPGATLLVNDYRTDIAYYLILESLKEEARLGQRKFLFDAVGLQSHMHAEVWPLGRVWDICQTYAQLGRPLHFTETTVVSGPRLGAGEKWGPTAPALEERQAEYVERLYTLLFSHPAVQAVTWWDFSDRGAWQGAAAGLTRPDMSPKPAYQRLHNRIKDDWWTRAEGVTNPQGQLALRAFCGLHKVTVDLPNGRQISRVVPWKRGQANRCEIVVA
jgi:GH35 family endo-1,4-beta-xylanase